MWLPAAILSLLNVISLVLANAEVISFHHNSLNSGVDPVLSPNSSYQGSFTDDLDLRLRLVSPPGNYFARVCWPASHPADLSVSYEDGLVIVKGDRSDVVPLNLDKHPGSVPFEVILSESKFGIPMDVMPTIVAVTIAGLGGVLFYTILVK